MLATPNYLVLYKSTTLQFNIDVRNTGQPYFIS